MFSDEHAQSFLVPRVNTDVVWDALDATPNLKFYVFAERNSRVWDNYTQHGNGSVFQLSRNQQQMYDDLMSILDEICLSGGTDDGFEPVAYRQRYDHVQMICY